MSARHERFKREDVRENDPWSVLGLRPGATPEEIRKAFRRRIKQVHPDSATADSIHIQSVCSLVQAYRFLEKRFEPEIIGNTAEGTEPETFLRDANNGLFLFLEVSARDAFSGNTITLSIADVEAACPACSGSGSVHLVNFHKCEECSGSGFHELPWGRTKLRVVCNNCGGKGLITRRKCNLCKGAGHITRQRSVDVRLPRGIRDGSIIRLPGQGHWRQDRQCRDALFVEVRVNFPEGWELDGVDVKSRVDVDLWTALAGGTVLVETLDGDEAVVLGPCSFDRKRVVLAGKGWRDSRGNRGDHIVDLDIVFPSGRPPAAALALIGWLRRLWPAGKPSELLSLPPSDNAL